MSARAKSFSSGSVFTLEYENLVAVSSVNEIHCAEAMPHRMRKAKLTDRMLADLAMNLLLDRSRPGAERRTVSSPSDQAVSHPGVGPIVPDPGPIVGMT